MSVNLRPLKTIAISILFSNAIQSLLAALAAYPTSKKRGPTFDKFGEVEVWSYKL